ncbi:hypothetical protein SAMN05444959_11661 [Paracoccus seriniphilus]|uniref:Uncharacterized protein n=1 Tax=Paracoccus seriniphilus TaxID=184748 RepID=A0A239Q1R0_9RHOB|nr:hypothetical protein SAMN05444959_11661 [Paracoccus seriniphilus]
MRLTGCDIDAVQRDTPASRRDISGQAAQQSGLARPVRADNDGEAPRRGGQPDLMQDLSASKPEVDILGYKLHSSSVLRFDNSTHMKNGPPIIAVTMPMGNSAGATTLRLIMSAPIRTVAPNSAAFTSSQR